MKTYPEHERMKAAKPECESAAHFLEWLSAHRIRLCRYTEERGEDGEFVPIRQNIESILAEYVGIDLKKIHAEKEEMLKEARRINEE